MKTNMILLLIGLMNVGSALASLPDSKKNPEDFFYAQQTSLWVFFKAPKAVIRTQVGETLDRLGFEIASFEDPNSGYIIVKPMVFMAEFGSQAAAFSGTSASTEVEFTVLVYPKNQSPKNFGTFDDFLHGRIEGSPVGQLRLDVLCDQEVAVAAGRKNFGEHKFLGSFEYSYPTPNNQVGLAQSFSLDMSAFTWKGAGQSERKMFRIQANLNGLKATSSKFSPELLFSSFPPEPEMGVVQKSVGEYRTYDNKYFQAFAANPSESKVELTFGDAQGAELLKPVAPFGDGKAIVGSEKWPVDMVNQMKGLLSSDSVFGYLLFKTPSAEYETKPFEIK